MSGMVKLGLATRLSWHQLLGASCPVTTLYTLSHTRMSLSQGAIATSVILCHCLVPLAALAEESPHIEQQSQVNPDSPPESNRPGIRGETGTTRDATVVDATPLMGLMTENQLTISQRPTFFFYIPEGVVGDIANFRIETSDSLVYQEEFILVGDDEILMISLNRDSIEFFLEPNTDYNWYFEIIKNSDGENQHEFQNIPVDSTSGTIRLMEANEDGSEFPVESVSIDEVELYQNENLWTEFIVALNQLHCNDSESQAVNNKWLEFLMWVDEDIGRIAEKPLRNITEIHGCSSNTNSLNTSEVLPQDSELPPRPPYFEPPDMTAPEESSGAGTR